jgi:acyl carrier protein
LSDLEQEVRAFIGDNYLLTAEPVTLAGGESLTQRGIIDSVGILELILFLETNYRIQIPDEEVVLENMDTVDKIVRYLERKLVKAGEVGIEHDYSDHIT